METFPLSNQESLIPNNPFQMKSEFVFYLHHELGEKSNHLKLTVLSNHSIDILCEGGTLATLRIIKLFFIYRSERRTLTFLPSNCQTFWCFIYLRLNGEEVVQIREK